MTFKFLNYFLLFFNLVIIQTSFASEKLYRIVRKQEWLKEKTVKRDKSAKHATDYIKLLTWEQIESAADKHFHGEQDLLLLEVHVSNTDPLLKWEVEEGSGTFVPHYYGTVPDTYIKEKYMLEPDSKGNFYLPKALSKQRKKSVFMPNALVNKVLRYQNWQNKNRLYKLQKANFLLPKVRLQWWYFDFFLEDSSTIVLAFIPQQWWDVKTAEGERESLFMISHRTREGLVKSFSANFKPSELLVSEDKLEIPSKLIIQSSGNKENRTYAIRVHFPELDGSFTIMPTQKPFAPFPTGVMPGYLQTLISGAPRGVPSFSYVSQVPEGNFSGTLRWEKYNSAIAGHAYHEQGRLDDTPEKQGSNWSWYHFSGQGWNIFGSPGTLVFIQKDDKVTRSGFHLVSGDYGIRNRAFTSPEHPKIITGGEIYFHHKDLTFRLTMEPATSKALIAYLSPDPNQVWATVEGVAQLTVSDGRTEKIFDGKMLLETCSWAESKLP